MKSSLFLVATSALLASAGPLRKRVMVTDWVVDVVTVTVTAGQEPASVPTGVFVESKPPPSPVYTSPVAPVVVPSQTPPAPPPPPPAPTTTEVQSIYTPPAPAPAPSTSAQPSAGSPPVNGNYQQTMLYQHNIHRANHSAPDLTWDNTLAQYAENTAKTCVFQHDMTQGGGGYGQNLAAWGSSGDIEDAMMQTAARGVTEQWYNGEFAAFTYYGVANPTTNFEDWGHLTQLVWKSTTKVGCATVECPAGTVLGSKSWYTVCDYNPQGNFAGEYANNVLEPLGHAIATV